MLTKRIIPCLDVKDGRTVKGVNFVNLRDAGDAVALGKLYAEQGADELVYLDITATVEGRGTFLDLVKRVAQTINIPFTVGGGITSIGDVSALLHAGADKVSINSAAVRDPDLINQLSREFGSQCIVVAIDTRFVPAAESPSGQAADLVHTHGGRKPTPLHTIPWAHEVVERGAGEILLTSMDTDGTKAGFALELTARISESVHVPVIASGGAGTMEHFREVFTTGKADAGLAASIFHFHEIGIPELKQFLDQHNIPVRLTL